jgi:hypothetical protein
LAADYSGARPGFQESSALNAFVLKERELAELSGTGGIESKDIRRELSQKVKLPVPLSKTRSTTDY